MESLQMNFMKALNEGDTACLMDLAKNGIDRRLINSKNECGCTALYIASEKKCLELVKVLVENGASLDDNCIYGNTALHVATDRNNIEIVKYLIKSGANVNIQNDRLETPLYKACRINLVSMVKLLLKNGADVNITDNIGRNVLYSVSYYGYYEVAQLLIKENIDINIQDNFGEMPLQCACKEGYIDLAKLLIENGASVDIKVKDKAILKWAIEREEYELVDMLIKRGAKLPIRWLIRENKRMALQMIVNNKKSIPLRYKNTDLLAETINKNNVAIANLLMRNTYHGVNGKIQKLSELLLTTRADEILDNSNEDTKKRIRHLKRAREQEEILDILYIRKRCKPNPNKGK